MKRLIRRRQTREFATREGGWTRNLHEAQDFQQLANNPREMSTRFPKEDLELYYAFGEWEPTEYDFTIPLVTLPFPGTDLPRATK